MACQLDFVVFRHIAWLKTQKKSNIQFSKDDLYVTHQSEGFNTSLGSVPNILFFRSQKQAILWLQSLVCSRNACIQKLKVVYLGEETSRH